MSETVKMSIDEAIDNAIRFYKAGRYQGAEDICWKALTYAPSTPDAWHVLGMVAFQRGNNDAAIACMRRACDLLPSFAAYWSNLSEPLLAAGKVDEAIEVCHKALKIDPKLVEARNNLGIAYDAAGKADAALCHLVQAQQERPEFVGTYPNLIAAYGKVGRVAEAIATGRKGVEIAPNHPEIRYNLSLHLLKAGEWIEGFQAYTYRWACAKFPSPKMETDRPQWMGEPIDDKTILIFSEQGHGDTMMISRYVALVAPLAKRLIWVVQDGMQRIARQLVPTAHVVGWGEQPGEFDTWCPAYNLPMIFGTTPETVPPPVEWRPLNASIVEPGGIGICYAGSAIHRNDANRSATAADFEGLPGRIVNLTMGKTPPAVAVDPMPMVADWITTAAIIERLDAVVTVDTAVAHLAATIGKPTMILIPAIGTDWRWMQSGERTPWYDAARLIRQRPGEPWREVVRRAFDALRDNDQPRSTALAAADDAGAGSRPTCCNAAA